MQDFKSLKSVILTDFHFHLFPTRTGQDEEALLTARAAEVDARNGFFELAALALCFPMFPYVSLVSCRVSE